jgi:hypothetical protein
VLAFTGLPEDFDIHPGLTAGVGSALNIDEPCP